MSMLDYLNASNSTPQLIRRAFVLFCVLFSCIFTSISLIDTGIDAFNDYVDNKIDSRLNETSHPVKCQVVLVEYTTVGEIVRTVSVRRESQEDCP